MPIPNCHTGWEIFAFKKLKRWAGDSERGKKEGTKLLMKLQSEMQLTKKSKLIDMCLIMESNMGRK